MTVLGLTGPAPNALSDRCDDAVCVDTPYTATVQEIHLIAIHLLCAAFDAALLEAAVTR
jgi:D-sedoheptulose 7-phosphate isomerase